MTDDDIKRLEEKFPWLSYLSATSTRIINTLRLKERDYQGSWQRRGGIGAFMMLARKWDRIESISKGRHYDVIEAGVDNGGDVCDDIDDLIGYLLLVRSEIERRSGGVMFAAGAAGAAGGAGGAGDGPGPTYVNPDRLKNIFSDDPVVNPLAPGGIRGVSLE